MTCIIIDDEPYSRMSIRGVLEEYYPHINILTECSNIPEAVKAIYKQKPDIVFLDVEMPYQNGFALVEYFEKETIDFAIIFLTAYNQNNIQKLENNNIEFLTKPVRAEALKKVIEKWAAKNLCNL